MIEDKIAEILDEYQDVGTIHWDDVVHSKTEYLDEFVPAKTNAPWVTYVHDFDIQDKSGYDPNPSCGQKWLNGDYATGGRLDPAAIPAHKCPHGCNRDRHAEPLTEAVARMYDNHAFDPNYSPEFDETRTECVGASYMGPNRPPPMRHLHTSVGNWTVVVGGKSPVQQIHDTTMTWLNQMLTWTNPYLSEMLPWQQNIAVKLWDSKFNMIAESKPEPDPNLPDIEVKWCEPAPVTKTAYTIDALQAMKAIAPKEFAPVTPVPASPGYDFSHIDLEPKWVGASK